MKKTSAPIGSVLWTGKNRQEIEQFCKEMAIDFFLIEGNCRLWLCFSSSGFATVEGSLIEAIKGYGIIKISKGANNVK